MEKVEEAVLYRCSVLAIGLQSSLEDRTAQCSRTFEHQRADMVTRT